MRTGSVTSAMRRTCPPQSGQRVMSMLKTRLSLCAQESGAVGGSVISAGWRFGVCFSVGWSSGEVLVLRRGDVFDAGTMSWRNGEFGANTPW